MPPPEPRGPDRAGSGLPLRAVVFDYGLTLVDFHYPREDLLAVLEEVRPQLGPDPPPASVLMREVLEPLEHGLAGFAAAGGRDYMDYYARAWRQAGFELDQPTLWRILDLEQSCWDRSIRLAAGALATLAALRAGGLRLAIASNAPFPAPMLHRQVRAAGLADAVDQVLFSSEIGWAKPEPEFYLAILRRLGVAAEETLFVGDRLVEDYQAPTALGGRAVLCLELARAAPPAGVPAIARLADLAEVVA